MNEIFERRQRAMRVIADTLDVPVARLTNCTTLAQLQLDSLGKLNLVFALEQEFSIAIPDESMSNIDTIGAAIDALEHAMQTATETKSLMNNQERCGMLDEITDDPSCPAILRDGTVRPVKPSAESAESSSAESAEL